MQPDVLVAQTVPAAPPTRRTRARFWLESHRRLRIVYRVLLAAIGAAVIVVGLVLIPLPGPGWLIVFAGLWILGLEFVWAKRAERMLRRVLARATARLRAWRERRRGATA